MRFFKLSGSGNDFIALPEPEAVPGPDEIQAWCRRGISLGADGLFTIRPEGAGVEMTYWNADGYPADLCLNGTRCAARLAFELGWGDPEESLAIRTDAGTWAARLLPDSRIAIDLPFPKEIPRPLSLEVLGETFAVHAITVGVPHLVLLWPESLATVPIETLGPPLRSHPALGPPGANVDLVRFPPEGDRRRMEIRTFERGVEGETLSCGTGVLASAAVGLALGLAELPLTVATQSGVTLEVAGEEARGEKADSPPRRWSLIGDARLVATGELLSEAALSPPAPPWEIPR